MKLLNAGYLQRYLFLLHLIQISMTFASGALPLSLLESVADAKILVVGAGGIGCELLKNLVLTGFHNIEVIDLDTIDVSNLNRQFLFQKKHVGCSKAQVAKDSVLKLCPHAKINAHHDSIFNSDYNMQYFKKFDVVMNALDNRAARNHVNRMCLAANIPLIESGSAGYLGQVTVIRKGITECYECTPAPRQKSFPGCTIRNTPSEPIHCIVWAKYLFNQLFGDEDADQDVSPDTADPEAALNDGEFSTRAAGDMAYQNADKERKSTRVWAKECKYDPGKIFNKLFFSDIQYLLSMDNLWKKREPPCPVEWKDAYDAGNLCKSDVDSQAVLDLKSNAKLFSESLALLQGRLPRDGPGILVWDKDDDAALNFTASAANIRAHVFGIKQQSIFQVKSMAGNIIPAIATTNAIVAGLLVMQAIYVLSKQFSECKSVFVCKNVNSAKKLLIPCLLDPPKPDCYVCREKPEITVEVNTEVFTLGDLRDKLLKSTMAMQAPDVEMQGSILISSDDEDAGADLNRPLRDFNIKHGSRLRADDFLQNYDVMINILHNTDVTDDDAFRIVSSSGHVAPKSEEGTCNTEPVVNCTTSRDDADENDDIVFMEDTADLVQRNLKRKYSDIVNDNGCDQALIDDLISKRTKMSGSSDDILLV